MKSTSESLSHPETSNGRAAGGNCVVARRGGEQPEADLRSQTKVNPIRFTTTASLLAIGEACRMSGNRFPLHPSSTREKRVVVDGWGENAGKVSCGSVEWERSGHSLPRQPEGRAWRVNTSSAPPSPSRRSPGSPTPKNRHLSLPPQLAHQTQLRSLQIFSSEFFTETHPRPRSKSSEKENHPSYLN